ncbi:hypothetical protein [Streptomyces sp. AHA2]|uniref:hypothetical protein n=1 Tax=Streptomyces sp. AHA2 TaxID=3064526 RepID=UPI002FDF2A54
MDAAHYWQATLQSRPLLPALFTLARQSGDSVTSIVSTALCIALSALSGNSRVGLKLNFSNRFPSLKESVGCFFQEALVAVDVSSDQSLAEISDCVRRAIMAAGMSARYSYFARRETQAKVEAERGARLRMAVTVDMSDAYARCLQEDALAEAVVRDGESTVLWGSCPWVHDYDDVFFSSFPLTDGAGLSVVVHRSIADRDQVEEFLRGIERLLVSWARSPGWSSASVGTVRALTGMRVRPYEGGWVYADHSWVNVTGLEQLISDIDGVSRKDRL